jgi:RNA polymerase sigma factor (sigma-70 family)
MKDQDHAQQAMMDGFLNVFKHLKDFRQHDEHSLDKWVRKIMVNQCLMLLRKSRAHYFVDIDDQHTGKYDDNTMSAEEIVGMINYLPPGFRTVFNLYAIDGYSHQEIAEMLGITESTSRSQLTHARAKLKELLLKHGWNDNG